MNRYRETFRKQHTFLAVIHAETAEQVLRNADIAQNEGADGAFLINHSISVPRLIALHALVRARFPSLWLGLNMLGEAPLRALTMLPDSKTALWTDSAGVEEAAVSPDADEFLRRRAERQWNGILFGGVAFKYQQPVEHPDRVAKLAMPYVDVITTSGPGTGHSPDVRKIASMKAAIGDFPLAIASGMTPENVAPFVPHADCFLVATGVSSSFTELDPARVRVFGQAVR